MLTAEARVTTDRANRYLAQLCRHAQQVHRLRRQTQTHDCVDVEPVREVPQVECADNHGVISLNKGRCTLQTTPDALILRVEAADEDSLQCIQGIIARDIGRFGRSDHLTVQWQRPSERHAQADEARLPR